MQEECRRHALCALAQAVPLPVHPGARAGARRAEPGHGHGAQGARAGERVGGGSHTQPRTHRATCLVAPGAPPSPSRLPTRARGGSQSIWPSPSTISQQRSSHCWWWWWLLLLPLALMRPQAAYTAALQDKLYPEGCYIVSNDHEYWATGELPGHEQLGSCVASTGRPVAHPGCAAARHARTADTPRQMQEATTAHARTMRTHARARAAMQAPRRGSSRRSAWTSTAASTRATRCAAWTPGWRRCWPRSTATDTGGEPRRPCVCFSLLHRTTLATFGTGAPGAARQ